MSFLITGGTGFIGSYVVKGLVEQGQDVIVYDLYPNVEVFDKNVVEKIRIVRGDITDPIHLLEAVKGEEIEYIVHLAYLLAPLSNKRPSLALRVNCEGTNNVFEVARLIDAKRVVWASSMAVYDPSVFQSGHPVNEDAPTKPTSMYGACKLFNELMGQHYYYVLNLDNIGLRFTYVYGSGRARGLKRAILLTKDLIEKPALGEKIVVPHGDSTLNWLYVKDAATAVISACYAENIEHRIFNIGGEAAKVRKAVDYLKTLLPDANIDLGQGEEYPGAKMLFDISRAQCEIGYEPSYTLEKGIKEYINVVCKKAAR